MKLKRVCKKANAKIPGVNLLLLLFFTLLNAFFAGAEMAVVSVNKNRIRSMADEGNKKAKVIEGLFEDSTKFLSTIQVAITFAGFYSSASAASGISPVLALQAFRTVRRLLTMG